MKLEIRDVAKVLRISERTIERWVRLGELPAMRIKNQWFVNKVDLFEWAAQHGVDLGPEMVHTWQQSDRVSIADAVRRGGVHYQVPGHTREAVLHAVVKRLAIINEQEREFVFEALLTREALGSTAIGSRIAIPHVRNPIILHVDAPTVTVCFLENAIDFQAPDNLPVQVLFTIISPTPRLHLQLLSRLMFLLQNGGLREMLLTSPAADDLIKTIEQLEAPLDAVQTPPPVMHE